MTRAPVVCQDADAHAQGADARGLPRHALDGDPALPHDLPGHGLTVTRVHLDTDLGSDTDDLCALAMLLGWPGTTITGVTTNTDPGGLRPA